MRKSSHILEHNRGNDRLNMFLKIILHITCLFRIQLFFIDYEDIVFFELLYKNGIGLFEFFCQPEYFILYFIQYMAWSFFIPVTG